MKPTVIITMISALLEKLNLVSQLEHRERGNSKSDLWNPLAIRAVEDVNSTL
jgi:hypothetical protein